MKVHLRNPRRELEVAGPMRVHALLEHLEIKPESVLVIRGDALASKDEQLDDHDEIEVRLVISGGSIVEECPMAVGNRHFAYKEMLNDLDHRSPGSKHAFLFGFLEKAYQRFAAVAEDERVALEAAEECGAPTPGDRCAFCRLRERAAGTAPVTLRRAVGT